MPSHELPELRAGVEYAERSVRGKVLMNLKSFSVDSQVTYLGRDDLIVGGNLVFNPHTAMLDKYDCGFSWSAGSNQLLGLKHESLNKQKLQIGKLLLFVHHYASLNQTLGTEFALDWQKRQLEARMGLQHKFNEQTSAKMKVDHRGYAQVVLRHKLNNTLTVALATNMNVKSQALEKPRARSLPFGV